MLRAQLNAGVHCGKTGCAFGGSKSTCSVVGKDIRLSDETCSVEGVGSSQGPERHVDLMDLCPSAAPFLSTHNFYGAQTGNSIADPDYIELKVSIDMEGNGRIVLPDTDKRLVASAAGGKTSLKVA